MDTSSGHDASGSCRLHGPGCGHRGHPGHLQTPDEIRVRLALNGPAGDDDRPDDFGTSAAVF
jgi:hypothetical protein